MGDRELGNIYEMRIYTYQEGSKDEVLSRWSNAISHREAYSPLAAGMYSDLEDGTFQWMHVWPYQDLARPGPRPWRGRRGTRTGRRRPGNSC